jgi:hypothetical protein
MSRSRGGIALLGSLVLAACGTAGNSAFSNDAKLSTSLGAVAQQTSKTFTAYITGYSYWDNTPVGTAQIALPVVHDRAGGRGTYDDPVTLAVGHSISGGRSTPDVPAGTRFYIERLQKYAIVEDVCGDGQAPQNGPCHTGHGGHPWFDVYVGGEKTNAQMAAACARSITDLQTVIINPSPNLPVSAGAVADSNCRKTVAQAN